MLYSAVSPDPPGVDAHNEKPCSKLVANKEAWREKLKTATYVTSDSSGIVTAGPKSQGGKRGHPLPMSCPCDERQANHPALEVVTLTLSQKITK